jgi:hypothetical protein
MILGQLKVGFSQSIPSFLPSRGLVGLWPFNGNSNDESENVNNGLVNGSTLIINRFGNLNSSHSFDDISNEIQIPFSSAYANTEMTILY